MLASDGAVNKVICKHCHKQKIVQQAGPSSDSYNMEVGESETNENSERSNSIHPSDSYYTEAKEITRKNENEKHTVTQRPREGNKGIKETKDGEDPSPRDRR